MEPAEVFETLDERQFLPTEVMAEGVAVGSWRTLEVSHCQAGTLLIPVPPQGLTDSSSVLVATLWASLWVSSQHHNKETGRKCL